jgi:hypothetical protein
MFDIPRAIEASSNLISGIINRIWPDPTEEQKAQLEQFKTSVSLEMAVIQAQADINKIEAANPNLFVSGWRPFVGWSCGISVVYAGIISPFAQFIAAVFFGYTGEFPILDTSLTAQILIGMLGLAGMRSFEKSKGVSRS